MNRRNPDLHGAVHHLVSGAPADSLTRRELLLLLGSAGGVALIAAACQTSAPATTPAGPSPATTLPATPAGISPPAGAAPTAAAQATDASRTCVVVPSQTEGPYFVDLKLNRSDLRTDASDGTTRDGAPLALTFRVSKVDGNACTPLAGVLVDVWQCDAAGVYSGVRDANANAVGKQFLRGYQTTDALGGAVFQTIYPGWYPGRAVHIHFKVRTSPADSSGAEFTSQLYFNEAVTDQVYARPPYSSRAVGRTRNSADGAYRNGGQQLTLQVAPQGQGYVATFDLGLWV